MWGCITDVPGLRVGIETETEALTGLAAVLFDGGAVGAVSVLGGAPGTAGTDALRVLQNNQELHAVVLTGGSAFGLASLTGVIQYLEEQGIGVRTRTVPVPIVAGAVVYDLGVGSARVRPAAEMGYRAAAAALPDPVPCGNDGPGAGATTGKWRGGVPLKSGLGAASLRLENGVVVGALVVVNAIGDVVNPRTGQFYATHGGFHESSVGQIGHWSGASGFVRPRVTSESGIENTTIGLVATNALLDKTQLARVAGQAHNGLARAIRPVHTSGDGDTLFAVSAGGASRVDLGAAVTGVYSDVVGALAADVVTRAVLRAMLEAESVPGYPSAREAYPGLMVE
jgi:L-aminopeptidase/D-esterase-like protein